MNRAAKQYLRQVKRHLSCPNALKREFLRQLEDDILLFCEKEDAELSQITAHFGDPKDVSEDFFNALDAKMVSHFACNRLKAAYWILAAVLIVSLTGIGMNVYSYVETQQILSNARAGDYCNHPGEIFSRKELDACTVFTVRTHCDDRDYYWEYHSCVNRFYHTLPPQDSDGTEPYAEDIYVNYNGSTTHWHFAPEHFGWVKVYDDV